MAIDTAVLKLIIYYKDCATYVIINLMERHATDFHIHSALSGDASGSLAEIAESAIAKGCKYIALTEHCNLDFVKYKYDGITTVDPALYDREFKQIKEKYSGRIEIAYGLEIGYDAGLVNQYREIVERYDYDYIVNSIHLINGIDCYFQTYFKTHTQKESYRDYLGAVYESLSAPYRFNSIGHLGYITRNDPHENRDMLKGNGDIVEAILKKMIDMNVALELNSSVNSAPAPCLPQKDIVKLYRALGGETVIYGSDAHSPAAVCRSRSEVISLIKDCGFKYHAVYIGKEIKMIKI